MSHQTPYIAVPSSSSSSSSSSGTALIFDPDAIIDLRKTHRIVGALVGTHPTNPLQNLYQSPPLMLMPEEAAFLLEKGTICFENDFNFEWPVTDQDKTRYRLFKELHTKGFYITGGLKFGGDYILYPGDPMRHHSQYVVTLLNSSQILKPRDLVAFGRLGTDVRKTSILCTWDQTIKQFNYISLNWSAFG